MMADPFFSIIMPAYNAENTIEHAVASIEKQAFSDYEFIIVDDGSTDRTADILRALQQAYGNIRQISIENAGPAAARNAGLELARGQFVLFLDSDDAYLEGSLQKIHDLLEQDPADILIYGFRLYNKDTDTYFHAYHPPENWCRPVSQIDFSALYTNNLLNQTWNKAYRTAFLRDAGITFPDYRYGEDRLFVIGACLRAGRIAACREELYDYVLANGDSLVHSYHADKFQVCCRIHQQIQMLVKRGSGGDEKNLNYMFIKSVFSCMTDICGRKSPLRGKEKREKLRRIICHETVRQAAGNCRCMNLAVRGICLTLRTRCVWLNYLFVKLAAYAMRALPNLTISLKHQH